jgi:hypothetical protein
MKHVEEYKQFCKEHHVEEPLLPLQTKFIEAWLTDLFIYHKYQFGAYAQRIAALRSFSRDEGEFDIQHLNYDARNARTRFCNFMLGLKRKCVVVPKVQAQAIEASLVARLMNSVHSTEKDEFLAARDIVIIGLCFLFGLRAVDLAVINLEDITFTLDSDLEPRLHVAVKGGKTTHEKPDVHTCTALDVQVQFDFVERVQFLMQETQKMYDKHLFTADEKGCKAFHNIFQFNAAVVNRRVSHNTITKLLRQRLTNFFKNAHPEINATDIDRMVSEYSSHSLRRGAVTETAMKGATVEEIKSIFHMKTTSTARGYVDRTAMKVACAKKRFCIADVYILEPVLKKTKLTLDEPCNPTAEESVAPDQMKSTEKSVLELVCLQACLSDSEHSDVHSVSS